MTMKFDLHFKGDKTIDFKFIIEIPIIFPQSSFVFYPP